MTLHRVLRGRLNQTVTVAAYAGNNAYGDASYASSATTYVARVEGKQHEVVDTRGQDVLARGMVFIGPTSTGGLPAVKVQDKVTLPDGTTPPLLAVDTVRDRDGVNHQVLHYG